MKRDWPQVMPSSVGGSSHNMRHAAMQDIIVKYVVPMMVHAATFWNRRQNTKEITEKGR